MKNVILYTRVSTDEQADKGFSLAHQKATLELYCKQKGYNILIHFQEDYSAKNFDRPEFKKLWAYVKANKKNIDALLFTRWDRFSRNTEEAYRVIREFKMKDIECNAMEQPLDLTQPDSKVMLGIYLILPEIENDKTSIRVKEGSRRAMKDGCYMGCAPVGYLHHRNEDGKATLKPNPEVAPIVKKVFEEYATGMYSTEEIRKKYYHNGLKVTKNTLLNMLKNPAYCGMVALKEYKKEDAMVVQGLHPAIIDTKTFETVQLVFAGKKVQPIRTTKQIDEILPLRGFLQCPSCRRALTGSGSRGRNGKQHYYYHCNPPCKIRLKSYDVHEVLASMLREFVVQEDFKVIYKKILDKTYKMKEGDREIELKTKKLEIEKLEIRLDSVNNKFFDELIDIKTYNEMKRKTESQIADLKAQVEGIKSMKKEFESTIKERVGFLQKIDVLYNEASARTKKKILASLFPNLLTFETEYFKTPEIDESASQILLSEKKLRYLKVG